MIDLDTPERVTSWRKEGGVLRRHTFRPITASDAEGFFSRVVTYADSEMSQCAYNMALLWLYSECALNAEGYRVKGDAPITSLPEWQGWLPRSHRIQAMREIAGPRWNRTDRDTDTDCVSLSSSWNESSPGEMPQFSGLIHRFAPPLSDHERAFECEIERLRFYESEVSVEDATNWLSFHKLMTLAYDELIVSVEGYSVAGMPLDRAERIARLMCPFHKHCAAFAFFASLEMWKDPTGW